MHLSNPKVNFLSHYPLQIEIRIDTKLNYHKKQIVHANWWHSLFM